MAPLLKQASLLCGAAAWLSANVFTPASAQNVTSWPLHNDGYNDVVEWDHYSYLVNGKRLYVFSGEFHYWRIPVPELWEDILQKVKAAGFNAFTLYAHWGYHMPNPTTLDFTSGAHDFTPLFEIAQRIGLYVLVRPGPYINAETNAGGFPLWVTTGDYGTLRDNDTRYTDAWTPYLTEISNIVSAYQISDGGGPSLLYQIENEYGAQWDDPLAKIPYPIGISYFELLEAAVRDSGITIPFVANNPNMNTLSWSKDYSDEGGNVDVYGVDSYPSCWSCNLDECTSTNGAYVAFKVMDYYDHFQFVAPTQPEFMPEFQGGSYNPWGGPQGGCPNDLNWEFANLFYRHNVEQRVSAMNLYMFFGGTSWGNLPAPVVGTSYDYSAPVSEDRSIGSKYYETKNLALFLKVAHDITMVDRLGNGTYYTTNPLISATELRNPETKAAFYSTIHNDTTVSTYDTFKLHVSTSAGNLTIPQFADSIALNGHQSKILPVDFDFGHGHSLLYSTAEVLSYTTHGSVTTLVLWVPTGESAEFVVKGAHNATVAKCVGCDDVEFNKADHGLAISLTQNAGETVFVIDKKTHVVVLDRTFAYTFWAPSLSADPQASEDESVLVQGPYLVRNVSISHGNLDIIGDAVTDASTAIEVWAPTEVKSLSWNGRKLSATQTSYSSWSATISPLNSTISLPSLGPWKAADSLVERAADYDDTGAAWVIANHTTTENPTVPGTPQILYADEYGFHVGVSLWRGYFSGAADSVFLNLQGATAFGWSAWLNGDFIGSFFGSASLEAGNATLSFANATVNDGENVLFIIMDNNGHDEGSGALNPRGILNATLSGGNTTDFTEWKLAGTAGGEANLDPIRGSLAEGGLRAERLGWTLPDFDDSDWASSPGPATANSSTAGVTFYRTVVPLSLPEAATHDISIAFVLTTPGNVTSALRAQLFVNGYQYGKFNPYIGHQITFPVPNGILDYNGDNTIGLSVWNQVEGQQAAVDIEWVVEYAIESGYGFDFDASDLRPGWEAWREEYA